MRDKQTMERGKMEALHEGALEAIEEIFGDRLKRRTPGGGRTSDGALASVFPMNADEVEVLSRTAERHSVPLVALGAGTAPEAPAKGGSILVRFDLMRGVRLPDGDEPWAEAEPGALWLELDNNLHARGWGLAVYPTSAPRATVGGWLATDGLGVGSFEYGRLRENVVSAEVVMPGGERRTVGGEGLRSVVEPQGGGGIVVGARLRTRRAKNDVPCALAFGDPADLTEVVAEIFRAGVPLWHLSFLNAPMADARGLGDEHLISGAYPRERAETVEEALQWLAASNRGRMLPPADAYRVWGERFFPIAPSHPTPALTDRAFITLAEVPDALRSRSTKAVQGTVARSGETLLIAFDADQVR